MEKTKGGIIIRDTAKEKPQEGEVSLSGPALGTRTPNCSRLILPGHPITRRGGSSEISLRLLCALGGRAWGGSR